MRPDPERPSGWAEALRFIHEQLRLVGDEAEATSTKLNTARGAAIEAAGSFDTVGVAAAGATNVVGGEVEAIKGLIGETVGAVSTQAEKLVSQVQEAKERAATPLDDLVEKLAGLQEGLDQGLLASIEAVKEGLLPAEELATKFGDALIPLGERMVRVRDLLREVLPSTGQIQKGIKATTTEIEQSGDLLEAAIEKLKGKAFSYAQVLADVIEKFRAGKATLQEVIRTAEDIRRQFPNSETGDIARVIANAGQRGQL